MSYKITPEQLREWASRCEARLDPTSDPAQLRAHADALEENARLTRECEFHAKQCARVDELRHRAEAELAAERERADRNQEDAERLDWMDKSAFTAYRDRDPEYGELYDFATVVNEDRKGDRVGEVFKTIREAIDAARRK